MSSHPVPGAPRLVPTLIAGAAAATPVLTAPNLRWVDQRDASPWSPDGRFLAFWTGAANFDPDTGFGSTLHFLDTATGTLCESAAPAPYLWWRAAGTVRWLPGGRAAVEASRMTGTATWAKEWREGEVCGPDFAAAPPPEPSATPRALSPGGGFTVRTERMDQAASAGRNRSVLSSVSTGEALASAEWAAIDYEDGVLEPEWIGEGEFLIRESADAGPLLLSARRGLVQVAADLFGVPQGGAGRVSPIRRTGGTDLVLESVPLRLYHADTGQAEVLVLDHLISISPDNRWLAAWGGADPAHQGRPAWLRQVADADGPWIGLDGPTEGWRSLRWSPDSTRIAMTGLGEVAVFSVADGRRLATWDLRPFGAAPGASWLGPWSPAGRHLVAGATAGDEAGLFVLAAPSSPP